MRRLVVRSCEDGEEWDRLFRHVPWSTPQHNFAWGQALSSSFGYLRVEHRLFVSDERVLAGLPLIRLSAGGPFKGLYSQVFDSYGGPLICPESLDDTDLLHRISIEVDSAATQCNAFEARLLVPPLAPEQVTRCLQLGEGTRSFTRPCPILTLHRPLDQIVHGYKASVRRAVRQSAQRGVVVEEDVGADVVRQAYPIYSATMKRVGGTPKPWRFIESLIRKEITVSFVARRNGRLIGLVVLLVNPRMALYWVSAADPAEAQYRPTNALVDRAIRWCHDREIAVFNFTVARDEAPGLTRFKDQWGASYVDSTMAVRIYRSRIQRVWSALEPLARRTYRIWDRWKTPFS